MFGSCNFDECLQEGKKTCPYFVITIRRITPRSAVQNAKQTFAAPALSKRKATIMAIPNMSIYAPNAPSLFISYLFHTP